MVSDFLSITVNNWNPDEQGGNERLNFEREQFNNKRDKNGDGRMDLEEIGEWILPKDYNPSLSEAMHLIQKADDNEVRRDFWEEQLLAVFLRSPTFACGHLILGRATNKV